MQKCGAGLLLLQAILLACCFSEDWPLLVVVPASLRGVWAAELQAWVPPSLHLQPGNVHIIRSGEGLKRLLDAGEPAGRVWGGGGCWERPPAPCKVLRCCLSHIGLVCLAARLLSSAPDLVYCSQHSSKFRVSIRECS